MVMDFPLETTFDVKFTSRAFATGIPTTLGGSPVVDIYEDNSLTQITAAETLTVDFDSVTGLNNLRIAATAANGFESGKSYAAVITTGTVGGVSVVGETVCNFSIERSAAAVDLANGTDGLGAIKTDTAAILTDTGTTLPATLATAQADLDTITGSDGVTLATTQANYAPATAAELAKVPKSDGTASWNATALAAINAECDTAITDGALATAAELAKVPKSDGTTSWNVTALAAINAECDTAISDAALATAAAVAAAQTDLDTITDTGVTCVALTTAAFTDIWATDTLTEAYAADGSAATPAQAVYLIMQHLSESSISGTTKTVKKLDGSTTAATFTLDDATTPTSITRAT